MSVIRVNVTLPEELLRRIDSFADENGMSRSGLLAYSARLYLDEAMPKLNTNKFIRALAALVSTVDDVE